MQQSAFEWKETGKTIGPDPVSNSALSIFRGHIQGKTQKADEI